MVTKTNEDNVPTKKIRTLSVRVIDLMTVPRDPQVFFSPREQVLTTDGVTQV